MARSFSEYGPLVTNILPMLKKMPVLPATLGAAILLLSANSATADGNLKKVNHIIIVMQENPFL